MEINILEFAGLAGGLFFCGILYYLARKKVDFGIRTISALIFGIILGLVFKGSVSYIAVIGRIYVNLIYALVVPLLAVSIISSIITLKDTARLKSIGAKSVGWLTLNTLIASTITLGVAFLLGVGKNSNVTLAEDYTAREVPAFTQVIADLFPKNIISDAAEGKIVPVIIFSLLVGLAVLSLSRKNPEAVQPFKDIVNSFSEIMFWIVKKAIGLTPYAVLALIANATSNNGADKLLPLLTVLVAAYLACILQTFGVGALLIKLVAHISPLRFFKKIWPAQALAFTSQSSMGTLPVTLNCLENIGVSKNIANFTASLGTSVGMPGCAGVWPVLLAVFAIQALGIPYSPLQYIFLVVLTGIVSLGTAGVPGTATITATAVFAAAGLPIEIIVVMTPISSIVDMARTATNVTGAAVSAAIVAKSERELDLTVFEQDSVVPVITGKAAI